jgi:hypothetical protein
MDGLRMERKEECVTEEEIGVLHCGKQFRYSRKMMVVDREEQYSEVEERDTGIVLYIEGIPCIEEKENDKQLSPTEGYPAHPTRARIYIEPTTPCASLRTEVRYETLSLEGRKVNSKGSQSSGISTTTHLQLVSSRNNIV